MLWTCLNAPEVVCMLLVDKLLPDSVFYHDPIPRIYNSRIEPIQCQGVVTYTSPVEAFATGIKNLDRQKSSLIA